MQAQFVSMMPRAGVTRQNRDQIVIENLALVRAIAVRVRENLPVYVDLEDLIHAGVLGLFDAVDKYDESKNVVFQSYAKHRIKGAILDSLRELDWASRDMRKRQKKVDSVTRELSVKLGRTPHDGEIADGMGVTMDRWRHMQMELRITGLTSTNSGNSQDTDRPQDFAAAADFQPDHMCEQRQLQSTLARALGTLPERYQRVVFLYYTNDLTMKQIADLLGVNESRISQIHKIALRKMAGVLESEGIHSSVAL